MPLYQFQEESQDVFVKAKPKDQVAIGIMFAEHAAAEAECHAFAEQIATACKCKLVKGPMKTLLRADEKVGSDYRGKGGESDYGGKGPWSEVKDLVRVTILASSSAQLQHVAQRILAMATNPWSIIKKQEVMPDNGAPCCSGMDVQVSVAGYSGLNFGLQKNRAGSVGVRKLGTPKPGPPPSAPGISNALWAKAVRLEIQANIPEMIYGKESAEDFVKYLGNNTEARDLFQKMKAKAQIAGGLGHVFYEISKSGAVSALTQKQAKDLSKRYYKYLRNPMPFMSSFSVLCLDLADYVDRNDIKPFFSKHPVDTRSLTMAAKRAGPRIQSSGAFQKG